MRTLSVLSAIALSLMVIGCSGKKPQELSKNDYETLKAINESFADNGAAVRMAFSGKFSTRSTDKVQKLAAILQAGASSCQPTFATDEPTGNGRYDRDWKGVQEVKNKGGTCVIGLAQAEEFKFRNREYTLFEDFKTSGEFQKEALVQSYTLIGGMKVSEENSRTKITGLYNFKNFKVDKLGLVMVRIQTNQSYSAGLGAGTANLSFQAKGMKHNATVSWSSPTNRNYRINGKTVDEKTMQELFSAYGLLDLVDRSEKMR